MYLKAILLIGQESPPVTVTKVAEFMGVSAASASEMIKRMEQNGLVDTSGSDGIALHRPGSDRGPPAGPAHAPGRTAPERHSQAPAPAHLRRGLQARARVERRRRRSPRRGAGRSRDVPSRLSHPFSSRGGCACPLTETMDDLEPGDEAQVISLPERDGPFWSTSPSTVSGPASR